MAFNRVDAQQVAVSCGFNSWDEIKRKINDAAGVSVPSQQESTILRACYGRWQAAGAQLFCETRWARTSSVFCAVRRTAHHADERHVDVRMSKLRLMLYDRHESV